MLRKTLIFTLLITLLAACAPQTSATKAPAETQPPATESPAAAPINNAILLTDGLQREVKLAAPAQRIISLAPSITEILFAIGAGGQVVGRDEYSDFPEAALAVESIGSTYQTLNTEAILALAPDLVVAADINSPEQIKALEDLGVTVYFFENPTDFDGVYQHLEIMGQLTGHQAEAKELTASLQGRVSVVTEKLAAATEKPKVFYEIDGSDTAKPWTSGPGTFIDTIITQAGGINIGGVLSDPFAQISLEEVVLQDPDFIVLGDTSYGVTVDVVTQRAGWESLTAVKNKKIFAFDDNLASRPGPRLVDGLEMLASIIHPELVPAQ